MCSIFALACVLSSHNTLVYCTGQAAHSLSHGGIEYLSHNGEFLRDVSCKLERERSCYYRKLGSPRAGTRITEVTVLAS